MVQIMMLLFAFPLGFFLAVRRTAYGATVALFALGLAVQTPLVAADNTIDAWYWVINAATLVVGIGLATWGNAIGARRRNRPSAT